MSNKDPTLLRSEPNKPTLDGFRDLLTSLMTYTSATDLLNLTVTTLQVNGATPWAANPVVETGSLGSSITTITHTFASGYDYFLEIEGAVVITTGTLAYIQMNGDSGSNYRYSGQGDDDTNASSDFGSTSATYINFSGNFTLGSSAVTGAYMGATLRLRNMASTSVYKGVDFRSGFYSAAARSANAIGSGTWKSTSAVTSISIGATGATPHFSAGTYTLYRLARS